MNEAVNSQHCLTKELTETPAWNTATYSKEKERSERRVGLWQGAHKVLGRIWEMQMRIGQNFANRSNERRHWLTKIFQDWYNGNGNSLLHKEMNCIKLWLSSHILPWEMACMTCIFWLAKLYLLLFSKRLILTCYEEAQVRHPGYPCMRLYLRTIG